MTSISKRLHLFVFGCILLLFSRVYYTGQIKFLFLLWNLFLAWIPFMSSTYILRNSSTISNFKKYGLILLCITFLPNAVYLITDLIHLKPRADIPIWFDAVLLFCFGILGLGYHTISLIQLEKIFKSILKPIYITPLMLFMIISSGYGVYLGRELRWNSWDAAIHPLSIIYDTIYRVLHPLDYTSAWLMTFTFAGLQGLFWVMFRNLKSIK